MPGYSGIPRIHQFLVCTAGSLRCVCDLFACVHTWGTLVNVKKFLNAMATHTCGDCTQSSCLDLAFHSEGSCSVPLTLSKPQSCFWWLWCQSRRCTDLCDVVSCAQWVTPMEGLDSWVVMVVPGCFFYNTAQNLVQRDYSKCIHAHTIIHYTRFMTN